MAMLLMYYIGKILPIYISKICCRLFQVQVVDQQLVTGWQFCTLFDTNIQHSMELVSCKHAEMNE